MNRLQTIKMNRKPLVRTLLEFGLVMDDIAALTGWSHGTIANDVREFGGMSAFPRRPTLKSEVFAAVFVSYAEMVVTDTNSDLRDALTQWIDEDKILATVAGMECMLEQLIAPTFSMEKVGYTRLLSALTDRRCYLPLKLAISTKWPVAGATRCYLGLLSDIACGTVQAPTSHPSLARMLTREVLSQYRQEIMPEWPNDAFVLVDRMLATLSAREEDIIRKYFGIGVEQCQLEDIGEEMGLSRERVRQFISRGTKKLRHSSREKYLNLFSKSLGDLFQPIGDLLRQETRTGLNEVLHSKVEVLELSVRSNNCMQNAGIATIGDLTKFTERDLLGIKNFGPRCLREVKDILGELGLSIRY